MRSAAVPIGKSGADDRRRLAAEFERHRRQIARRVGHHRPAGSARTREDQVIERQRGKRRAPTAAVVEKGELVLGKVFWREFDQQFRQPARVLRHLHHRPIACGEDADERSEAQIQRIIPRNDHADYAERLRDQPIAGAGKNHAVYPATARTHPALEALGRVVNAVEHREDFGERRLEFAATAVVAVDRGHDRRPVLLDQPGEPLEVGDPLGVGRLRRLQIGGALGVETGLELGGDGDGLRPETQARSWTLPSCWAKPSPKLGDREAAAQI